MYISFYYLAANYSCVRFVGDEILEATDCSTNNRVVCEVPDLQPQGII